VVSEYSHFGLPANGTTTYMANNTTFEVYTDKANQERWRLKAGNGEIVAVSEGYSSRYAAKQSAQKVKDWAGYASVTEIN